MDKSGLGLEFLESGLLSRNLRIVDVALASHDETYAIFAGKSSHARDHHNEMIISLKESASPHRRLDIIFRAFNDGIAFRYFIPDQKNIGDFVITDEHSTFLFPPEAKSYGLSLDRYTTNYERTYRIQPVSTIDPARLVGLPFLLECDKGIWAAVTEANLTDYAGMYLKSVPEEPGKLYSALSPYPDNPKIKVKGRAPFKTPWRVVMVGDNPGTLIESNIVLNLNEPNAIGDTDWIKVGKMNWPWWNNHQVGASAFEPGMNVETMKYYIDFFAEHGIDYHGLVQHKGWTWWTQYPGKWEEFYEKENQGDPTTPIPQLDFPELMRYAKENGMGMRLHMHWAVIKDRLDEVFQTYEDWGIHGIMWDFMDRDDQWMVNHYHEVMRKAAEHHLTVIAHGAYKPTGIRRTYPNLLTREGVLNLEFVKWSNRCNPEHNVTIPFTRMLGGPLDYHLGGFRSVARDKFKPNYGRPEVMGTRCHNMAMYIVYESPVQKLCDAPDAYRDQPGFEFLKQVPTTWDETRVLEGIPADYIVLARRKGDDWYVGSMTNWDARTLELPLSFLTEGTTYEAEIWSDGTEADSDPNDIHFKEKKVTSSDTLSLSLASGGGHVLVLKGVHDNRL